MTIQINGTSGISGVDGSAGTPALQGSDSNTGISFGTDEVNINTGGSTRATVDSSGRLLVGTPSATSSATLQIQGNTNGSTNQGTIFLRKGATPGSSDALGFLLFGDNNENQGSWIGSFRDGGTWTSGSSHPGRLVFSTTADGASSPSERMTIRADGTTVTTGTTILSGGSSTAVSPRSISFGSNEIAWTGVGSGGTNMFLNLCNDAGNNGGSYSLVFRGLTSSGGVPATLSAVTFDSTSFTANAVYNLTTAAAANVHVSPVGTLYRSTSSAVYKKDIETIEDAYSEALLQCRPVWYRSIADGDSEHPDLGYWGFIAEEVAEVDPRLVFWKTHEYTTDIDGNTTSEELDEPIADGVQYDRFVPHLLNLIKRQQQAIETLEASNADLETRLTALEGGAA